MGQYCASVAAQRSGGLYGVRDRTGDDPQAVEGDEPVGVVSIVLGFALMMALDVAL